MVPADVRSATESRRTRDHRKPNRLFGPTTASQNRHMTPERRERWMPVRDVDMGSATDNASDRGDLSNRWVLTIPVATALATVSFFIIRPWLPPAWSTPGSPELYLTGLVGTAFVLVPLLFSLTKRVGVQRRPPFWFSLHLVGAVVGVFLLFVHSGGHLDSPPTMLLLLAVVLIAQGTWMRVWGSQRFAAIFSTKLTAFRDGIKPDKNALREILVQKQCVLETLDGDAVEATFSPRLRHWIRRPAVTFRYIRLVSKEGALMGTKQSVPRLVAHMRAAHILMALLFWAGLLLHVLLVTFFAEFLSDGEPVHWWHISDLWAAPLSNNT